MGLSSTIGGFILLIFGKYADVLGLIHMAQIATITAAVAALISIFIPMKYVKLKAADVRHDV